MSRFHAPFADRQAMSVYANDRYRRDGDYRLRKINRAREQQGLPPRASLEEVRMRVPMEDE
jgi:hypothetical protein